MFDEPLAILAVLGVTVSLSEWLSRHTPLRHFGAALLVILLTAVWANLGLIPTGTDPQPLYESIFADVAPLSIFLLLLGVRLADVRQAGLPMIGLFGLGALGTFAGVMVGMSVVDGPQAFGELQHALGGMFVGTYVGGSLNFNLIGTHYGVTQEGALYTGAVAVDSILTSVWMIVALIVPRVLSRWMPVRARRGGAEGLAAQAGAALPGEGKETHDEERASPLELGLVLGLGAGALVLSRAVSEWSGEWFGRELPSVLVLTTVALILAQVPAIARLRGPRLMGMFGVLLFLAVIGAYCDLAAFEAMGALGPTMLLFVVVILCVHGLVCFGGALLLGADVEMAAVASVANVGGGTTALAMARSLRRSDLVLPAILVGSLGTAAGTYLGFLAASVLA